MSDRILVCAFCEKDRAEVAYLIGAKGTNVYICDECVGLCNGILEHESERRDRAVEKFARGIREFAFALDACLWRAQDGAR